MTKLEIGLTRPEPAWLQILGQERVNYRLHDQAFSGETPRVIIVSHPLTEAEVPAFRAYVESGAGVLTDFPNLARLNHEFKLAPVETIHYIEPEARPVFDGIGLIDLELPGYCSNQANCGRLDNQGAALFCGPLGKGQVIALPFDVGAALRDTRRALKALYWEGPEFPYEEMAVVSRNAVRRLCVNALRELCSKVGQPYAHIWYYPEFKRTAFAFRVDGDFANKDQIHQTVELALKQDLKFSWYVNTKSQRALLGYFADLARTGHDVQLHCHEHKVFDDLEHNLANIRAGIEALQGAGLKPAGFVGPFGHWNENLDQALEQTGFKYSSEFGLAYDDFPFYPLVGDRQSKVMQIPLHPLGLGRLLQARLKHDALVEYFKSFFRVRYLAGEPLFIYDHPHRIAEHSATFDAIFKIVAKATDVWYTTLTEFHDWWLSRADVEIEAFTLPGTLTLDGSYEVDMALHVIDQDREALVPMISREFEYDELAWKPVRRNYPYKPEMIKTRKLGRHLWLREQIWKAGRLFKS